jgi:hypothetical protein
MAIIKFVTAQAGDKGETGISNDRDLNSMIMLAWQGGEPIVKGYDLYTNNFSSSKGIDSESVARYNTLGYYETVIANTSDNTVLTFTEPTDIHRTDKKGSIYRWAQDNEQYGHFEGMTYTLTSGGAAVNKGGGKVGLPCVGQPYSTGNFIEVRGSTNYNNSFTVDATSSVDEIVITSAYSAETFGNSTTVNQRITLGAGNDNTDIQLGLLVDFYGDTRTIMAITGSGYRFAEVKLDLYKQTYPIKGIYDIIVTDNKVVPGAYLTSTTSGWSRIQNDGPNMRYNTAMSYDTVEKNVWMFGGYGQQSVNAINELWKYSTVSGQWTRANVVGSSPTARYGHSMILDPVNRHLIVWGGYIAAVTNEMWKYSLVSGTWTQQTYAGGPTARRYHTATYMTNSGTMLIFGGNTGSRVSELWEYTIGTNAWRQMSLSSGPTARDEHVAIYQTASGAMIIQGGNTGSEVAETWKLDYTSNPNRWVQLTSSSYTMRDHSCFYDSVNDYLYCIAGYRQGAAKALEVWNYNFKTSWTAITPDTAYATPGYTTYFFGYTTDTDNNVFYVFGGQGSQYRNSLWSYSPSTNVLLDRYPDMRYDGAMVFVKPRNKVFLGYGQNNSNHPYNDFWQIDCATNNISRVNTSSSPVGVTRRRGLSMVYSPVVDAVFLFSGEGVNTNDLMKYDFATNNWYTVYPTGALPVYRYQYGSAYDTDNDRWYIFGGTGAATYSEFWYYDVKSNSWVKIAAIGTLPSARRSASMAYDPINRCIWLFGGFDGSATYYNTLYKYVIESNTWIQMQYTGASPAVRCGVALGYDYKTHSLLLFGGYSATRYNDFYRYDIVANTMYTVSADLYTPQAKSDLMYAWNDLTGDLYIYGGNTVALPNHSQDITVYNLWDLMAPSGIVVTTTSGNQLNTKAWDSILNITPSVDVRGSSNIYHALSFDNRQSFVVASGTSWLPIVRTNSGNWEFLNSNSTWQSATTNNEISALQWAMTASGNRMTSSVLSDVTTSGYTGTGGFSTGTKTLDFAIGFDCVYNYVPEMISYSIDYTAPTSDIILITEMWEASANDPTSALVLLDIVAYSPLTMDSDIKVWISTDNGANYTQITGLTLLRNEEDHTFIKGIDTSLTVRSDNRIKCKITTHNSKRVEIHALGVAVRY